MNERIRELMMQSWNTYYNEEVNGTRFPVVQKFDAEKFAELIVRQCGYYADIFEAVGCPDDMDPTETKPSDYIKRHFGVEE